LVDRNLIEKGSLMSPMATNATPIPRRSTGLSRSVPRLRALAISFAVLSTWAAAEGTSSLIPVEEFTRRPKLSDIKFSPDGKSFAALTELKGRRNIAVAKIDSADIHVVSSYETADVGNYRWISSKRLIFSLLDLKAGLSEQDGGGLFAVDADGKDGRNLSPTAKACQQSFQICRYTRFWARIKDSEDEIIAVSNERVLTSPDLVRLNTRTGARKLMTVDNPGRVAFWVLDADLVPRAALSEDVVHLERTFWYRSSADTPWEKITTFKEFEPGFSPLGFAPDGTLYVSSTLESKDKAAIHVFDPKTRLPGARLARHPSVDLGLAPASDPDEPPRSPLIFEPKSGQLTGLFVPSDIPQTVWLDEKFARIQGVVDASLPKGRVNEIRPLTDNQVVVFSYSGSEPGVYYLYDSDKRALREVIRPRSGINPDRVGTVQALRYKARDGLDIPAFLTLPAGKPPTKLPLVVWIHGGPWASDVYRWDDEVQFLASRGYAVLQPNFRGSTGFGLRHLGLSFKKLGQSMQDDITDGVRKLIADGTVDPQRVCLGGGSYGGYATLMGLVREPELFKCGIDVVGVVDLNWWIELGYTDFNRSSPEEAGAWLRHTIGDPSADREMMEANSPRLHARKIKAPVLIVSGANDQRVPIAHAEAMRDALKAAGNPPEWLVFGEEGHGFMRESNRTAFFTAMERFLAKHIGN
jgi:dipeptidyl aminopeptidase/acylaminoacyl peptidase